MKTEKKYRISEFLQSKNSEKELNDNEERQGRDTRQKLSGMTEEQQRHRIATWVCNNDTSVVLPECSCRASRSLGFTLVELVIVIAIVIVLSVVSVPIYRSYVDKAKMTEGYALLGTILSAQKAYYSEHGNFLHWSHDGGSWGTDYDTVAGIDARGNKYFTWFDIGSIMDGNMKYSFWAGVVKPEDLRTSNQSILRLRYDISTGSTFIEDRD